MFLITVRKNRYDVISQNPSSNGISPVSASNHIMRGPFLISYCGNKLWSLGVLGPKKFCMPWRITPKQVSRITTLAKCDFRKSRGISPPPRRPFANPYPTPVCQGTYNMNKKGSEVWQLNNINIRRVTTKNMNF